MQEKSDGRTLILKCDNRGGSTPRRDMASRERGLQVGQQAAHMGRTSTGSRPTGSLLTPTPVIVKYTLRAQLLARKFGAKASEPGTCLFHDFAIPLEMSNLCAVYTNFSTCRIP